MMEDTDLPAGYELTRVPSKGKGGKENYICYELIIKSRVDFDQWLTDLSHKNNVQWRKQFGDRIRKGKTLKKLEVNLVCHHANLGQKGVRTTNTK